MKKHIAVLALLAVTLSAKAQQKSAADSLMNAMSANDKPVPVAIFKSTRLVLAQTTEMVKKNELNFQIIHRFGDIAGTNGGGRAAFGIDRVNDVFFGFEYGVSDNFNLDWAAAPLASWYNWKRNGRYCTKHQMAALRLQ
ncbi:hypothetical protein HK413_10980 [Mucilaginibacter sp. S1162]|uniref:DUF5777 domain-containing protein n=1 Tax=Mucilaginibacter humi TaxID=2732510 RepID=A0ABX1W6X7_9SPHI|nr:DUF5777 family beta-barrel protein [Mucilaginibacter humi]NNU34501.1 hypothetical protein [Mucilaginibacter humi]